MIRLRAEDNDDLSFGLEYSDNSRSTVILSILRFSSNIPDFQSMPDLTTRAVELWDIVLKNLASSE